MQRGTGSDQQQSAGRQKVHSSERQHQADLQQSNSDVWLQPAQLGVLWDGAELDMHPGSVVQLWSAWLFDCAAGELGREPVAVWDTEDFETEG